VSESASLTAADKLPFLDLSYVVSPEVGRPHALGVEADSWTLPQPVREPGQVAVAVEVVGVKTTAWKETRQYLQTKEEQRGKQPICPALPSASNYANLSIKCVNEKSIFHSFHWKSGN